MRVQMMAAAVLLLIGVVDARAWAQGEIPATNVTVDEVRSERLVRRRAVTGEIRSMLTSALASQVEGLLVRLDVEEGDQVRAGQVLARLDDARARIAVDRARAAVDFAQAVIDQRRVELDNATRDFGRIEELERLGSSGVSQMDQARTLVASRTALLAQAQSELTSARGELALAQRELEDMTIEAPFDGRVVRKVSEVGQWVGRGDEVVVIVSLDRLEARVDIPEDVYAAVRETMEHDGRLELRLPALGSGTGDEVYGRVISILPSADSLSRLFPVRIEVNDPGKKLRPGMSLTAMVPTRAVGDYITISKDAIVRTGTGEVVYFVNDGVSAIAPVERLFAVGDRMAVRSPMLKGGMSVVVSGNERMFPGQKLNILSEPRGALLGGEDGGGGGGEASKVGGGVAPGGDSGGDSAGHGAGNGGGA